MIWGKTTSEKYEKQKAKEKKWFAWYPVRLINGHWAWLQYVYYIRYYKPNQILTEIGNCVAKLIKKGKS